MVVVGRLGYGERAGNPDSLIPRGEMMILIEVETESKCACHGDQEIYIPVCYNYGEDSLGFLLVDINLSLFAVSPNSDSKYLQGTHCPSIVDWFETGRLFYCLSASMLVGWYIFNDHKRI